MRHLIFFGTFSSLVAALFFLWQFRFERSPDIPTIRLVDLRAQSVLSPGAEWLEAPSGPRLLLRVGLENRPAVARLAFPAIPAIQHLHVRFKISAANLTPGSEIWKNGRCIIEWHPEKNGRQLENDPFGSARYHQSGDIKEFVMRPDHAPAIPVLRLENLGISGSMELSMFEATVLRERGVWKFGRFGLMAACMIWVAAWIGPVGKRWMLRPLLASTVWLVMAIYFVVPGPWKILHSFGPSFQIGPEIENSAFITQPPEAPPDAQAVAAGSTSGLEPVGKIAEKGDLTLRIKRYAAHLRPLLHSLLLFAPTLVMACLIGSRRAAFLMVMLALGIEAAQVSFGYGFDAVDVFDLFSDGIGIGLGLLGDRWLRKIKSPRFTEWLHALPSP